MEALRGWENVLAVWESHALTEPVLAQLDWEHPILVWEKAVETDGALAQARLTHPLAWIFKNGPAGLAEAAGRWWLAHAKGVRSPGMPILIGGSRDTQDGCVVTPWAMAPMDDWLAWEVLDSAVEAQCWGVAEALFEHPVAGSLPSGRRMAEALLRGDDPQRILSLRAAILRGFSDRLANPQAAIDFSAAMDACLLDLAYIQDRTNLVATLTLSLPHLRLTDFQIEGLCQKGHFGILFQLLQTLPDEQIRWRSASTPAWWRPLLSSLPLLSGAHADRGAQALAAALVERFPLGGPGKEVPSSLAEVADIGEMALALPAAALGEPSPWRAGRFLVAWALQGRLNHPTARRWIGFFSAQAAPIDRDDALRLLMDGFAHFGILKSVVRRLPCVPVAGQHAAQVRANVLELLATHLEAWAQQLGLRAPQSYPVPAGLSERLAPAEWERFWTHRQRMRLEHSCKTGTAERSPRRF